MKLNKEEIDKYISPYYIIYISEIDTFTVGEKLPTDCDLNDFEFLLTDNEHACLISQDNLSMYDKQFMGLEEKPDNSDIVGLDPFDNDIIDSPLYDEDGLEIVESEVEDVEPTPYLQTIMIGYKDTYFILAHTNLLIQYEHYSDFDNSLYRYCYKGSTRFHKKYEHNLKLPKEVLWAKEIIWEKSSTQPTG